MHDHASRAGLDLRQVARILVLAGGLFIALVGIVFGGAGALVGFLGPASDLSTGMTLSVSFAALSVGLGLSLAWQGWQASRGQGSRPFRPRRVWSWILLFALAVLAGQSLLSLDLLVPLTFPPFHIAAAFLPSIVILAAVGRSLGGATRWREMVLQVSSGAFLSTLVAFSLEFLVIVGLIAALLLMVVTWQPGGLEVIRSLTERLQDPVWLQNPAHLGPLVSSPPVLLAAALVFAGLIPLVEEAVKALGVPLLAYRRPTMAQAFLWGLAGGAGFAAVEGLFNTLGGLEVWAPVVSMRVGASLLHCFTGGLMGLAWYYLLMERRWLRALGLYAASAGVHGLWNGLAGLVSVLSLSSPDNEVIGIQGLTGAGALAVVALLLGLALAVGLGLAAATRWVRRHSPGEAGYGSQPASDSSLASIEGAHPARD